MGDWPGSCGVTRDLDSFCLSVSSASLGCGFHAQGCLLLTLHTQSQLWLGGNRREALLKNISGNIACVHAK